MSSYLAALPGALILAPLTRGGNLPYRRLCQELGARITTSEMAVARRLKQDKRSEFALIRAFEGEACFGVQLAGNKPEEMAWAAALVESRGAQFVDINLGCPIQYFTSKGLGAALLREPTRVRRLVRAMKDALQQVPVTVKIRLGWSDDERNYLAVAQAAVEGGADAVTVHGRTRAQRYRLQADWDAIADVARALPVPVIGNGDLTFGSQLADRLTASGCVAVMTGRGALIKPWIFREAQTGNEDITADARVAVYRRYATLARQHWGETERGLATARGFVLWHLGFWCRYAPPRADGSFPVLQQRESWTPRSPLEAVLARHDDDAHQWLADALLTDTPIDPEAAPPVGATGAVDDDATEAAG